MCVKYKLDPVAKEVYLSRAKDGRLMIIIAIDGWIKAVQSTPGFAGFTWEMHFEGKNLEWVDCFIFSSLRPDHPVVYRAFAAEYAKVAGFIHGKMPWHMLRLFAFRHAARFFAPMSGAMTEDEARWMNSAATQPKAVSAVNAVEELLNEPVAATDDDLTDEAKAAIPEQRNPRLTTEETHAVIEGIEKADNPQQIKSMVDDAVSLGCVDPDGLMAIRKAAAARTKELKAAAESKP